MHTADPNNQSTVKEAFNSENGTVMTHVTIVKAVSGV